MMNTKTYYKITFLDDIYYKNIKNIYIDTSTYSYKEIIEDIIGIIKEHKNSSIQDFYLFNKCIYDDFCLKFTDKYNILFDLDNNEEIKQRIIIEFASVSKSVNMYVYDNKRQQVLRYYKEYVLKKVTGNCINRFVELVILPKIHKIQCFINSINYDSIYRNCDNDYFSSLVYENDFTHISIIRDEAKRIYELCNKQLELMSEKYSKL